MNLGRKWWIAAFAVLTVAVSVLTNVIDMRSSVSILTYRSCESMDFRKQELDPHLYKKLICEVPSSAFSQVLTVTMLDGKFHPAVLSTNAARYRKYKKGEFRELEQCYQAVWEDIFCFPVKTDESVFFENTFGEPRTYGGTRTHEGTDIYGEKNLSGYYPIQSMTSGTVEQVGWLPLGGYRIGIRALHGGYFYYAHLSGYSRDFRVGETVNAGDLLGFMGNTGYGPEGTAGVFPVHLHLGIYIRTPYSDEMSVNPYYVLKASEIKNSFSM
ncbi:MAG: M23 family metallopeptidase [Blautia sp.]|nr:M23 family metallopeptidase [Blautia sp.]MDY5031841.1 M23 family metallopeptidase [Blautia sp.]